MTTSDSTAPVARSPLGPCQSFAAGHGTHPTMIRLYSRRGRAGTILGFRGNFTVLRLRSGEEVDWWHHNPRRLRAAAIAHGGAVKVYPAVTALQIQGLSQGSWFYCSPQASPCGFLDREGDRFGATLTEDAYTHDERTYVELTNTDDERPAATDPCRRTPRSAPGPSGSPAGCSSRRTR